MCARFGIDFFYVDIIMNKIANAGSVYLVPNLNRPISLAMNLFLIRIDKTKANPIYVFNHLKLFEPYIKQFANGTAAVTITNTGVTSNVAGTDITVSGATGAVTIGTNSTLATVTGRGASTNSAISLGSTLTMGTTAATNQYIRMGLFPNTQSNSGEAWIGRASDRNAGTMTVQLGGGSASSRNFEVVDYAWTVVLFSVGSNGTATASGDIVAYSDRRIKENIETITGALEKVTRLRGVTYTRTDIEDKSEKIGFIAQEVNEVIPQVVIGSEETTLGVAYGNITALHNEAIKEQQLQIEELKAQIAELKQLLLNK